MATDHHGGERTYLTDTVIDAAAVACCAIWRAGLRGLFLSTESRPRDGSTRSLMSADSGWRCGFRSASAARQMQEFVERYAPSVGRTQPPREGASRASFLPKYM